MFHVQRNILLFTVVVCFVVVLVREQPHHRLFVLEVSEGSEGLRRLPGPGSE